MDKDQKIYGIIILSSSIIVICLMCMMCFLIMGIPVLAWIEILLGK